MLHRSKEWWDCALSRAERTVAQTLMSMLPVGFVVTPTMLKEANWEFFYVILAWALTGLIGGLSSIITSFAKGIPEVEE